MKKNPPRKKEKNSTGFSVPPATPSKGITFTVNGFRFDIPSVNITVPSTNTRTFLKKLGEKTDSEFIIGNYAGRDAEESKTTTF